MVPRAHLDKRHCYVNFGLVSLLQAVSDEKTRAQQLPVHIVQKLNLLDRVPMRILSATQFSSFVFSNNVVPRDLHSMIYLVQVCFVCCMLYLCDVPVLSG